MIHYYFNEILQMFSVNKGSEWENKQQIIDVTQTS